MAYSIMLDAGHGGAKILEQSMKDVRKKMTT